jgi:hypothetical protein
MKAILFVLILASSSLLVKAELEDLVCLTWRGFGQGLTDKAECSASINVTCACLFDVLPELLEFFKTMDFSKLGHLIADLYEVIWEGLKQWNTCNYFVYLVNFFPHLIKFFSDIFNNWLKIKDYIFAFYLSYMSGDYYSAGLALGKAMKVILAD